MGLARPRNENLAMELTASNPVRKAVSHFHKLEKLPSGKWKRGRGMKVKGGKVNGSCTRTCPTTASKQTKNRNFENLSH